MSCLFCSFCSHRNPAESKFCNECGSPLHLVPCGQCEAVNHVLETHCYRCGEVLASQAGETVSEPASVASATSQADAAAPEILQVEVSEPHWVAPVGLRDIDSGEQVEVASERPAEPLEFHDVDSAVALEHPDLEPVGLVEPPGEVAYTSIVPEDPSVSAPVAHAPDDRDFDDTIHVPPRGDAPGYGRTVHYRMHAAVFAALFIAVAGAVYWSSIETPRPAYHATLAEPSDATPMPAASPVAPAPASDAPATPAVGTSTIGSPGEDVSASTAAAPASPDAAVESKAPPAAAAATVEPSAPAEVAAKSPNPAPAKHAEMPAAAEPSRTTGVTSARSSTREKSDAAKRANAHVRTREEAERDALATQRLVARSLADAPSADPGARPAPAR